MVAFLRWAGSIGLGVLNGVVKFVVFGVLAALVIALVATY